MKLHKFLILQNAMDTLLNDPVIADGKDGYIGENLHVHMAHAAAAVYDSHADKEDYLKQEGMMED